MTSTNPSTSRSTKETGLSRRRFLKGVGTALALPLLSPELAWADGAGAAGDFPKRILFLYAPNGKHMQDWTPRGEGSDFELPYLLEPLAPFRDRMHVLSGLTLDGARAHGDGPGDHARSVASFLTGAHPAKQGAIRNGISVDQVAARHVGDATKISSLELGMEGGRQAGECDSGYSCAYSSYLSWRSPTTPSGKEVHPRRVFDRLFADPDAHLSAAERARRKRQRGSILDLVLQDAADLRGDLGATDRRKVEEYMSSVRELEKRIEREEAERHAVLESYDVPAERPATMQAHLELMYELIVLALQTDTTRVCSFMLGNAGSNRSYPWLGVREGHHYLSHHGGDRDKQADIRKINRFHTEQLAGFLTRMRSVTEGDGTLLDNTLIVYGSGIADGNRHDHGNLPVLFFGGKPGAKGVHRRYDHDTPLCNLYVRMLDEIGVRVRSFGDSTGALPGLAL